MYHGSIANFILIHNLLYYGMNNEKLPHLIYFQPNFSQ